MSEGIQERVRDVEARIAAACARAGRTRESVVMVAVSKTKPVEAILEAAQAGVRHFGENRVEEALTKIPQADALSHEALTWHMVGHLQSRKARHAGVFDCVHSVDSLKLAIKLDELSRNRSQPLDIFLEINISGEASKYGLNGVGWQESAAVRQPLWETCAAIARLEGLNIKGLMTMAPFFPNAEQTRPVFRALAELRDALRSDLGLALPDLSMGMTNDYEVAIEEGATYVRIGRAIFGER